MFGTHRRFLLHHFLGLNGPVLPVFPLVTITAVPVPAAVVAVVSAVAVVAPVAVVIAPVSIQFDAAGTSTPISEKKISQYNCDKLITDYCTKSNLGRLLQKNLTWLVI